MINMSFGSSKSQNQENRGCGSQYGERRKKVEGGEYFTEVVQLFDKSQKHISEKLDQQNQKLDEAVESLATLPNRIKTEVLNSTEFKKVQSRSLRNDDELHKLKKKVRHLEASLANVAKHGAERSDKRRRSTHSHHKRDADRRSSATSSSAKRSRPENYRDGKSKSKHVNRDRSFERRKTSSSSTAKPSEGQNIQSGGNKHSRGRTGQSSRERSTGTSRAEPSGRREYEPQPGPSGVVTTRFTHDGRTVHRRQDLDQVGSDDDRFSITRNWHTRRERGPGDPPLRKVSVATGKALKKGPINRVREKSGKKRKSFLYGTREKALNEIERLMRTGISSDEAIFMIANDKEKAKLLEDAEESNLKTWYAARKEIRERIRQSPRIRDLRACKGL